VLAILLGCPASVWVRNHQAIRPDNQGQVVTWTGHKPAVFWLRCNRAAVPTNGSRNFGSNSVSECLLYCDTINTPIAQCQQLFHLPLSDLLSDQHSLNGSEMTPYLMQSSQVLDSYSMNIGQIANLTAGGEREDNTA